jgi:hypothetical protein
MVMGVRNQWKQTSDDDLGEYLMGDRTWFWQLRSDQTYGSREEGAKFDAILRSVTINNTE